MYNFLRCFEKGFLVPCIKRGLFVVFNFWFEPETAHQTHKKGESLKRYILRERDANSRKKKNWTQLYFIVKHFFFFRKWMFA